MSILIYTESENKICVSALEALSYGKALERRWRKCYMFSLTNNFNSQSNSADTIIDIQNQSLEKFIVKIILK